MRSMFRICCIVATISFSLLCPANDIEELNQKSPNPMAELFSFTVRDVWSPSRWQSTSEANVAEFITLVPTKLWGHPTLLRVSVPYRTNFPTGPTIGDARIYDLVTFTSEHILWGVGPVLSLRPRLGSDTDTIQGGAALGVAYIQGRWSLGLLVQNLFSGQVSVSTLLPTLSYKAGDHWTFGLGELPFVIDWKSSRPIFVPLGFQVGYLANISGQFIRFFTNPQYNTKNIAGSPQWTLTSGISFLIR